MIQRDANALRQAFKQKVKEAALSDSDETPVRMHRVARWLEEGQQLYREGRDDLGFITCWIAWNALYCQWDEFGVTSSETAGMRDCIGQLNQLDADDYWLGFIHQHRATILVLVDDGYLSADYWREVAQANGRVVHADKFSDYEVVESALQHGRYARVLEGLCKRLYVLRNQLIHGGATPGSSVNRVQVERGRILEGFMLTALTVIVESRNPWQTWGRLPYPVQRRGADDW